MNNESIMKVIRLYRDTHGLPQPDAQYDAELAKFIMDAISLERAAIDQIRQINILLAAEHKRHSEAVQDLERKRAEVQSKCPHYDDQRYPDPAGGKAFYECNACGRQR